MRLKPGSLLEPSDMVQGSSGHVRVFWSRALSRLPAVSFSINHQMTPSNDSTSQLLSLPPEAPDIMEQKAAIFAVPCLNSHPTETVRDTKRL